MNIGIVTRNFIPGGPTSYIHTLLAEFNQNSNHNFYIFTDRLDFSEKFPNLKIIFIKNHNLILWDYFQSPQIIKKCRLDAIIYPKNFIPLSHKNLPVKKINIVHDLAYFKKELNAYRFWDTLYFKNCIQSSCDFAQTTIAVSQNTKNDLLKYLKISPEKIRIIYEGLLPEFKKQTDQSAIIATQKKLGIKPPFIFYAGTISPRKNILRLLQAFAQLKEKFPHNLYLTGHGIWSSHEIYSYINKELKSRVFVTGRVSDSDLINLYSSADLLLYPSLYEGFGLPIIEAQACGCPVLTSNTSSCSEIALGNAHLVNPYSLTEIKEGIYKIISDLSYKNYLISKGYQNSQRFSSKRCAEEIIQVINKTPAKT